MANTEDREKLLESYKPKILAIRNYKSDKDEFFVDDFINLDSLEEILMEVDTGESDLTPAGKKFLEDYYGFEELASLLSVRKKYQSMFRNPMSKEEIKSRLENWVPMEIATFIQQAQGNLSESVKLRDDLLPPEAN